MRSIAKPILITAGIFFALWAAAVLCLNIYLQSGGVQLKLKKAVFQATGLDPVISQTYYTPWSGLTLSGIKVPQGENAKKPLLALRAMKCQVSLIPLLQGRVLIKEVTFEHPALLVVEGQSPIWPLGQALPFTKSIKKSPDKRQAIIAESSLQAPAMETATLPTPSTSGSQEPAKPKQEAPAHSMPVMVENVRIYGGQASIVSAQGGRAIRIEDFAAEGKESPDGSAKGTFLIKNAVFSESVRFTDIKGNFEYHKGQLQITDMQGDWAKGRVTGTVEFSNAPESFFSGWLAAENVSLQKLAEDAGFSAEGTQGLLFAKTRLQGIPGQPASFTGEASARLSEARLQTIDPLRQLGELLRINELSVLELRTAETALTIRDGKILVDRLELASANLLMDATGTASLDGSLDLDARFHVTQKLLKDSLGFMGSKFQTSEREGYSHMPFSITGTMARPKSDLLDKLVGVRIGDDVGGLLKNLLRMPKKEKKKKDKEPAATPSAAN
ncbi:MAG: AsmA-like C-terminal region-containing protein [bacterium]